MTDVFNGYEAGEILKVKACLTNYIINNNILRDLAGHTDIVIAGGFFASVFNVETPNDTDVFILNNNVSKFSYLIYTNEPDPSGAVWSVRNDAGPYLKNPHIKATALNKDTKVQYILTDFTSRKELLADFDFVHCTTSYVPGEDKLYITREAYDCIMKKELRNNKKDKPADWRIDKFMSRGWRYALKEGMVEPKTNWIDDMITRHGNQDAVLAYQNR